MVTYRGRPGRERAARRRALLAGLAVAGARGVGRARPAERESASTSATSSGSTSSAGRSRRRSPASGRWTGGTRAPAGSCSCSGPACSTRRRRRSSRRSRGPTDAAARARFQRDLRRRFPNVSVIDVREILADVGDGCRQVTLAVTVVGALVLVQRHPDPVGAVSMTSSSACTRRPCSRRSARPPGTLPRCCRRVRPARRWPAPSGRRARWRCPGGEPVTSSICRGAVVRRRWRRRRGDQRRPGRGRRRARQPGRPPAQAAGDAARRVGPRMPRKRDVL